MFLLAIDFFLLHSILKQCCKDHIFNTNNLIRSLWPNIRSWMPLAHNYHICNNSLSIFAKVYLFEQKTLILIWHQTLSHNNSPTGFLSVFFWSGGGGLHLNKVESNKESGFLCELLNIGTAASTLAPSTFSEQISNTMSFYSFLNILLCIWEA